MERAFGRRRRFVRLPLYNSHNGKGLRPQAVFVGVTTGGRHARPPMGALDGKGLRPQAWNRTLTLP
jgi:hypothetical protein